LSLARAGVSFLSAHDGMLAEWLESGGAEEAAESECLLLVDVVPYASEAPFIAECCKESGRGIVVVTDELCYWAKDYTDSVIYARSRSGLFLESTVGLTAGLNAIVHAVANRNPDRTKARLDHWKAMARKLNVF
jgi:DNA-binding MurR/RpiR family transcriptional regulator